MTRTIYENEKKDKYIRFYLEAMPDERASREAGRPMFKDQEMVEIKFVGDRENTLIALAHEKAIMDPQGSGRHLTYAERFPERYRAFQADNQEVTEGTPIDHLPFLGKSQVAEFRAQNVRTVEGLRDIPDRLLSGKMGWRDLRERAKIWLEEADKMALVSKTTAENDELRARLEKLEAMLAHVPAEAVPAPDDVDTWTDEALNAFLGERGVTLRANAARATKIGAVREFMADA